MAVYAGADIVEDGLVLCLDAANRKSYPGTGTTWTSLIQSTSASLINGPTFSNLYNGGIVNDNLNDYIGVDYTISVSNFTISIWCQRTHNNYWSVLWSSEVWNNGTGYLGYLSDANTLVFSRGGGSSLLSATITNSNLPSMYTFSLDSSNNARIYQNNSLISSGSITFPSSIEKTLRLNARYSNDGSSPVDTAFGNIYSFSYYNKVISATEVSQNFNALRGRFNL